MKKDVKLWAIKLRGRSFYQGLSGVPYFYATRDAATIVAARVSMLYQVKAEPVRVKVRVEEVS